MMISTRALYLSGLMVALAAMGGCGEEESCSVCGDPGLDVAGTWTSEWGTETIGTFIGDTWGSAVIVDFDNDARYAITQNPSDAEWGPNQFHRLVWTEVADDGFYYCTVDFSLDTFEEAQETTAVADDTDPANGGCGDFSWTYLTRLPASQN